MFDDITGMSQCEPVYLFFYKDNNPKREIYNIHMPTTLIGIIVGPKLN